MNKLITAMFAACALLALPAWAQTVCDVTYSADVETVDGQDVSSSSITLRAVPFADVLDNHAKQIKVLSVLSKEQDKGGQYRIDVGEYRTCDGGAKTKVEDGSAMLLGVTLAGSNRASREALRQADHTVKRYEDRAAKGDKTGWDHKKAQKSKRNDLGQKVRE